MKIISGYNLIRLVAERWNVSIEEVIQLAIDGKVNLWIYYDGFIAKHTENRIEDGILVQGHFRLHAHAVGGLLVEDRAIRYSYLYDDNGAEYLPHNQLEGDFGNPKYATIGWNDLFISGDDVKAMEHEYPHLRPVKSIVSNSELSAILDPAHPWYSELLAISVKCWVDLYSTRDGQRHDNRHKPARGHRAMIMEWLKKHKLGPLSNNALDHIGSIVNPDKKGSSRKMS